MDELLNLIKESKLTLDQLQDELQISKVTIDFWILGVRSPSPVILKQCVDHLKKLTKSS